MANGNDKTMLYVALAGAAGLGVYAYIQNTYRYEIASVIATEVVKPPSLVELLLGSARGWFERARALDTEIKARGGRHYRAWKAAIKARRPFYAIDGVCFDTKTGAGARVHQCPANVLTASHLEGW